MTAKQTLQPKLRFPEFNGDLEVYLLKDIAAFSKGKGISKSDISIDGKYECIRYGQLYTVYGETISNIISKTNVDKKNLIFSEYNDVIIPASGETQLDIATASCVLKGGVALGGDLNIIRTKNNGVFISYYLNNSKKEEIASLAQGISVVHLYSSQLSSLKLNLPSIQEQTKIANFLSSIDEKINLLKEKKSLLEAYKKGMMQKIFNQEIRFKDDNGNDFENWEEKTLGEVGSVLNGLTYSPDDIVDDGVLVLRSSNIQNRRLSFNDNVYVNKEKFTAVVENDILICVRNGSRNLIGKNTLITKDIEGVAFGAFMSVYRSDFNNFLIHWFDSNDYNESVNLNLGATINSINGSDLKKFKIPFPSLKEQTKIANFLSAIDEKIALVATQIQDTQEYKKGLLQQMFI